MNPPPDRRLIIAGGAAVAIVAAVGLAFMFGAGEEMPDEAPPASRGGLTVALADAPELEPSRQLRCFVDGQFVGLATLSQCAERNGLATEALDVGLDETGALAAAPTAVFAPPPSEPELDLVELDAVPAPIIEPREPSRPVAPAPSGSACLRHTGSDWRTLSNNMSRDACIQALYAGTCVRPGDALYGRWGETTLRLVPRRVEQSPDNSRFSVLISQDDNCHFPELR